MAKPLCDLLERFPAHSSESKVRRLRFGREGAINRGGRNTRLNLKRESGGKKRKRKERGRGRQGAGGEGKHGAQGGGEVGHVVRSIECGRVLACNENARASVRGHEGCTEKERASGATRTSTVIATVLSHLHRHRLSSAAWLRCVRPARPRTQALLPTAAAPHRCSPDRRSRPGHVGRASSPRVRAAR